VLACPEPGSGLRVVLAGTQLTRAQVSRRSMATLPLAAWFMVDHPAREGMPLVTP
jgi:hypothetical protein